MGIKLSLTVTVKLEYRDEDGNIHTVIGKGENDEQARSNAITEAGQISYDIGQALTPLESDKTLRK